MKVNVGIKEREPNKKIELFLNLNKNISFKRQKGSD